MPEQPRHGHLPSHLPPDDLYAWQAEALRAWRLSSGKGIVEAVTGSGKTFMALAAVADFLRTGQRCLVVVPSVTLLEQWRVAIRDRLGPVKVGLLGGGYGGSFDPGCTVTLGVVNTVRDMAHKLDGRFALIVADEVHRYGTECNARALLPKCRFRLGMTATLERSDDGVEEVIRPYFGSTVYTYDYAQALKDRVVAAYSVALIGVDLGWETRSNYEELSDEIGVCIRKLARFIGLSSNAPNFFAEVSRLARTRSPYGKLAQRFIGAVNRRKALLGSSPEKHDVFSYVAAGISAATKSIVFCADIDGAEEIAELLKEEDVACATYHSKQDYRWRQSVLDKLQDEEIEAVVAVNSLDEGIDVPDLDLGVIVSGSRRRRQMVQRMGRILRRKDDDRGACFVVIYARDTVEDPMREDVPEGHFAELLGTADHVLRFVVDDLQSGALEVFVDQAIFG